jgi:hypothetical protein
MGIRLEFWIMILDKDFDSFYICLSKPNVTP